MSKKKKSDRIKFFREAFFKKDGLTRDILTVVFVAILATLLIINHHNLMEKNMPPTPQPVIQSEPEKAIDVSQWKFYKDSLYNFKISYPDSWGDPQVQVVNDDDSVYQYQARFGTTDTLNGDDNDGFSVFVSKKTAGDRSMDNGICLYARTQNDPNQEKSQESSSNAKCLLFKLKVASDDSAYHSYQFMGQEFEYNLIPALKIAPGTQTLETKDLASFEAAVGTFMLDFDSIQANRGKINQAKKVAAQKAKIINQYPLLNTAPGVCPDPHEKPRFSDTKKRHIDEDCCPDPDEWPNLHCRYKTVDYGVMLKGSPPEKMLQ